MYKTIALSLVLCTTSCATNHQAATSPTHLIHKEQFALELIALNVQGQTRHIKYNRITGEAWWSADTSWAKIQEPEVLPHSVYEIQAVATGDSWRAIRIDKISGKAWKNNSGKWVAFTQQVEQ